MQDLHGTMKDDLSALTTSGKATCTAFGMCHWRWQHGSEIGSTCSGGRRTRHIMSVWLLGAGSIVRHCLRWLRCVVRSHGRCESDSGSKVQHHRERARRLVEALLEAEEAPSGHAAAA
jgi:hypothetical protein